MNKKNKRIIFIVGIVGIIIIGLLLIISAGNKSTKKKQHFNDNQNVEIIVKDNPDGLQEPSGNIQENHYDGLGAAKVDDITGKQPSMDSQPMNTDEMLRDKEIEI